MPLFLVTTYVEITPFGGKSYENEELDLVEAEDDVEAAEKADRHYTYTKPYDHKSRAKEIVSVKPVIR